MSPLLLAAGGGILLFVSLLAIATRFLPAVPDLGDSLERLGTHNDTSYHPTATTQIRSRTEHVGGWVQRRTSLSRLLLTVPEQDLALMQISPNRWIGERVIGATLGLLLPLTTSLLYGLAQYAGSGRWIEPSIQLPILAGLVLGIALSFLPYVTLHRETKTARPEWERTIAVFTDVLAVSMEAGMSVDAATRAAARCGDNSILRRIRQQLDLGDLQNDPPWDGLTELGVATRLPELIEVASIVRLSGSEGAAIAEQLRARAADARTTDLSDELGKANAESVRLVVPGVFLAILLIVTALYPMLGQLP